MIYIFQSGKKKKKSRLISLTDSGCLGYFLFIKVKLPWVASGVPSDGLSLKIPLPKNANSCLKPGEPWGRHDPGARRRVPQPAFSSTLRSERSPFGSDFSRPNVFRELDPLSPRGSSTAPAVSVTQLPDADGVCGAWRGAGPLGAGAVLAVLWGRSGGPGCRRRRQGGCGQLPAPGRGSGWGCCRPPAWAAPRRCLHPGGGHQGQSSVGFPGNPGGNFISPVRWVYILRTERVLEPDTTHYLSLIKSKYQNPLV